MIVCICNNVSEKQLKEALLEGVEIRVADLCGRCTEAVNKITEEIKGEQH